MTDGAARVSACPAAPPSGRPGAEATGPVVALRRRLREDAREPRIGVLDDDAANVLLLTRLLGRTGYADVTTWTDPRAAVEAVLAHPVDVLLLDLRMPGLDGYGVLEALAPLLAPPHELAVLVLTADPTTQTRHRALAAGARDFLTKPFDLVELALRVGALAETAELHRALREQNDRLETAVAARTAELVRLSAELAHDVRTPLYAIRGTAEVLLDFEDGLPDALRADLTQIDENAQDALRLLDQGIRSARGAAGRVVPAPGPTDVAAVLEELREVMGRTPGAAERLRVRTGTAGAGSVVTDAPRLAQALRVLAADALGGPGVGEIVLHAERSPDGAAVAFHVDGPPDAGAPDAAADGIGLPVARDLARGLGGGVAVGTAPAGGPRRTATVAADLTRPGTSTGTGPTSVPAGGDGTGSSAGRDRAPSDGA